MSSAFLILIAISATVSQVEVNAQVEQDNIFGLIFNIISNIIFDDIRKTNAEFRCSRANFTMFLTVSIQLMRRVI
jgi:hypothetical protein